MVPQRVVVHEALPKTPNGKIDRLGLAGGLVAEPERREAVGAGAPA